MLPSLARSLFVVTLLAVASASAQPFGTPRPITSDFLSMGVAVDGARLVICDTAHGQLKFAPLTALAASSSPTFTSFGAEAAMARPVAVVAVSGRLFVLDQAGAAVHRFEWNGATYVHGSGPAAPTTALTMPSDLALDAAGNLYVLDASLNKRILKATAPGYTSWAVWVSDPTWPTCLGFDITGAGDRAWLACVGEHPVLEVTPLAAYVAHGLLGRGEGQLYEPQDVAIAASGELVVADWGNARIELLHPPTGVQTHIAESPLVSQPTRLALAGGALFVSNTSNLLAFFEGAASTADVFVRDHVSDLGVEPSDPAFTLTSPDLIIRQNPDIILSDAEVMGLAAWPSQEPRTNTNNYVYVAVSNRGPVDALSVLVQLYTAEPTSPLTSATDWNLRDFFRSWDTDLINEPNFTMTVDRVPALTGYRVIGPLVWRPTAPRDLLTWDGRTQLLARLALAGDATVEGVGLDAVRASNNVARREVTVRKTPPALGFQNTLVVMANLADVTRVIDEARLTARLLELNGWVEEVGRGATVIEPIVLGPYTVSGTSASYRTSGQDPLVELTNEVLQRAWADNPAIFDGLSPMDPSDDVARVIVVVNDPTFPADRATTQSWPYTIGGATRWISTSIHTVDSELPEWAHGFSHQLGLKDLFVYAPLVFDPRSRLPAMWDVMARDATRPLTAVHPLAISKALVPWLAPGAGLRFIPRPAVSIDTGTIPLAFQSLWAPGQTGAIALGFTPGVTDFADETNFLVFEARSPTLGNADMALPGREGVLAYHYNSDIPQGEGPVLLDDHTPATVTADDAVVPIGASHTFLGAQLSVLGRHAADPLAGYDVRVQFTPTPLTDLGFDPQEVEWESPDLWVDSSDDGFQDPGTAAPGLEQPRANDDNYLYARVHNYGGAPAYDVEVQFALSSPFHTVGGENQFDNYGSVILPVVPANGSVNARIYWHPTEVSDPHHCVRVRLRRLVPDMNLSNDEAFQNLQVQSTTPIGAAPSPSPGGGMPGAAYLPVALDVQWRNTAATAQRIYYRADVLPSGWTASFTKSATVAPGAVHTNHLEVKAPKTAALCTTQPVRISAWAPRRDTLERLGGATLVVALKNPVALAGSVKLQPCSKQLPNCQEITVNVQSTWPKAQKVLARFTEQSGYTHFSTLTTDALGKGVTVFRARNGGVWSVRLESPGDKCRAPAVFKTQVGVNLAYSTDQDKDGLPDAKELTGDADKDGVENIYDPDSDNDKRLDGNELPGDSDKDGTPNVIDPDP